MSRDGVASPEDEGMDISRDTNMMSEKEEIMLIDEVERRLIENIEDDNVYVFRCFLNCTLIIVASDFYSSIPWLDVI